MLPPRVQSLLAAATAACLTGMAVWFMTAGGLRGGLVHHNAPPEPTVHFTVNINTAGAVELAQVPGLGPTTAERLVAHRRAHGPFASIDGLLDVPGIGAVTLDGLRAHLRAIAPAEGL